MRASSDSQRSTLEVERVRYGDRLQLAVDAGGADDCLVPSLLLQPIVENAVTHGVAHRLEGGLVRVSATKSPARVTMIVENPCDADRPRRTGGGIGLANVRSRLSALYGNDATVNASERDGLWRVEISLPCSPDKAEPPAASGLEAGDD